MGGLRFRFPDYFGKTMTHLNNFIENLQPGIERSIKGFLLCADDVFNVFLLCADLREGISHLFS